MKTDNLTASEAAIELDVHISRIKRLCQTKRLGYTVPKHGRSWVITRAEISTYRAKGPKKPGPKKP